MRIEVAHVEARAAASAERRAWTLADALVGRDAALAATTWLELRARGERLSGLTRMVTGRLRLAVEVAERLEAGEAPAAVKPGLRMPARAAERLVRDVQGTDAAGLRRALGLVADLEVASRGGGPSGSEDTAAVRAVAAITATR